MYVVIDRCSRFRVHVRVRFRVHLQLRQIHSPDAPDAPDASAIATALGPASISVQMDYYVETSQQI